MTEVNRTLIARPERSAKWLYAVAALVVVAHVVFGLLLRQSATGVYFRPVDQVALMCIGLLIALGILTLTRPRVWADEAGLTVRLVFTSKLVEWDVIRDIAFPDGAQWARIELPDDEYVPLLAIQAYDRDLAVNAVRELRDRLARHRVTAN